MRAMSWVRMRVASSDWCPSRIVVSVTSARVCARIHSANFSGPSRSSVCLVPSGTGPSMNGTIGAAASAGGSGRSRVSGWPLIVTSAM